MMFYRSASILSGRLSAFFDYAALRSECTLNL
jgi:hypothetical protein